MKGNTTIELAARRQLGPLMSLLPDHCAHNQERNQQRTAQEQRYLRAPSQRAAVSASTKGRAGASAVSLGASEPLYRRDEPIPFAWHRRDIGRFRVHIAQQLAQLRYGLIHGRRAHDHAAPDFIEQPSTLTTSPAELARHISSRVVRGSSFCVSVPFEMVSIEATTIHSPICNRAVQFIRSASRPPLPLV